VSINFTGNFMKTNIGAHADPAGKVGFLNKEMRRESSTRAALAEQDISFSASREIHRGLFGQNRNAKHLARNENKEKTDPSHLSAPYSGVGIALTIRARHDNKN
jgi:hypothetical protein